MLSFTVIQNLAKQRTFQRKIVKSLKIKKVGSVTMNMRFFLAVKNQ